jgi:hypothetical protein
MFGPNPKGGAVLENINLQKKLSREEYKRLLPALQARLYDLEKACWDRRTLLWFEQSLLFACAASELV